MAIYPEHARYFVSHPLGLQDMGDGGFVHPGLVAVPQAMRGKASEHRHSRRQHEVLGWRLC